MTIQIDITSQIDFVSYIVSHIIINNHENDSNEV